MSDNIRFRNFTSHDIAIVVGGRTIYLKCEGTARSEPEDKPVCEINGVPVIDRSYGNGVRALPDPEPGVYYIVSHIALKAAIKAGRTDCLAPDSYRAIRDKEGSIVGIHQLIRRLS